MGLISAAYFDASGNKEGYPFLVVAGGVAPIKKWIRFESQWSAILNDEGVKEFHATDFAANQGEYKDWKGDKPRRSSFIQRLIGVIEKNVNKLFLLTVEMEVWNRVNREYCVQDFFHSPYALAGFSVATQAKQWAMRKGSLRDFNIFFEDGDEGWGGLKQLCNKHIDFEPIRIPKQKGVPFQVGDMLAWKARVTATYAQKMSDMGALLRELSSLNRFFGRSAFKNGIYTYQGLKKTCEQCHVAKRPVTASST